MLAQKNVKGSNIVYKNGSLAYASDVKACTWEIPLGHSFFQPEVFLSLLIYVYNSLFGFFIL